LIELPSLFDARQIQFVGTRTQTHTPSFWQQDLATGCRHSVGPPIRGSHRMAKGCCIGQVRVCRLIALEIACDETYGLCKEDVAVTRRYLPG